MLPPIPARSLPCPRPGAALVNDLRSLDCVRSRCAKVLDLARRKKTAHFTLDESKIPACVEAVIETTRRNYPGGAATIPYHSRWRHLPAADVDAIAAKWPVDAVEKVRRLIDLVTVSVLLDAGAGDAWSYTLEDGTKSSRSEGLALASLDMFKDGIFSSDLALPHRVNSMGLRLLQLKRLEKGFQVSKHNPIIGLEGRFAILQRLGVALDEHPEFFGTEVPRPGNLVDYVLKHVDPATKTVSLRVLWRAVIEGLESIWPSDTHTATKRGDCWVYSPLKVIGKPASDIVPFHKLSQWLSYSLLEPLESLGLRFTDMHLMTGLAEYRNGGLFVDTGVITPRRDEMDAMLATRAGGFDVGSEVIVEWRALTVALLDIVAEAVRAKLGATPEELPLAKVLQGGTWAAGREVAKAKRADGSPPIKIRSDGTVF